MADETQTETKQRTQALENILALKDTYNELFHLTRDTQNYDDNFYARFTDLLNSNLPKTTVTDVDPDTYRAVMAEVCYFIFSRDPVASQEFFRKSHQRPISMLVNGYLTGLMLDISNDVYIKSPRFVLGNTEKYEVRDKEVKPDSERTDRGDRTDRKPRRQRSDVQQTGRTGGHTARGTNSGGRGGRNANGGQSRGAAVAGRTGRAGVVRRVITEEFVVDNTRKPQNRRRNTVASVEASPTEPVGNWGDDV